jgi:hypothetical protein
MVRQAHQPEVLMLLFSFLGHHPSEVHGEVLEPWELQLTLNLGDWRFGNGGVSLYDTIVFQQ